MGRSHEPTLVEGDEGDDVAIGQRWHILATRYNQFHRHGPCTEKAFLNQTLHAHVENVRARPWLHRGKGMTMQKFWR